MPYCASKFGVKGKSPSTKGRFVSLTISAVGYWLYLGVTIIVLITVVGLVNACFH